VVNTLFCAKVFVRRRGPGTVEAFEVPQVISSQNEAINVAADQPRDEETAVEGTKACPNGCSFNWESMATRERESLEAHCVERLLLIHVSICPCYL
jgi:hypothetical protein